MYGHISLRHCPALLPVTSRLRALGWRSGVGPAANLPSHLLNARRSSRPWAGTMRMFIDLPAQGRDNANVR